MRESTSLEEMAILDWADDAVVWTAKDNKLTIQKKSPNRSVPPLPLSHVKPTPSPISSGSSPYSYLPALNFSPSKLAPGNLGETVAGYPVAAGGVGRFAMVVTDFEHESRSKNVQGATMARRGTTTSQASANSHERSVVGFMTAAPESPVSVRTLDKSLGARRGSDAHSVATLDSDITLVVDTEDEQNETDDEDTSADLSVDSTTSTLAIESALLPLDPVARAKAKRHERNQQRRRSKLLKTQRAVARSLATTLEDERTDKEQAQRVRDKQRVDRADGTREKKREDRASMRGVGAAVDVGGAEEEFPGLLGVVGLANAWRAGLQSASAVDCDADDSSPLMSTPPRKSQPLTIITSHSTPSPSPLSSPALSTPPLSASSSASFDTSPASLAAPVARLGFKRRSLILLKQRSFGRLKAAEVPLPASPTTEEPPSIAALVDEAPQDVLPEPDQTVPGLATSESMTSLASESSDCFEDADDFDPSSLIAVQSSSTSDGLIIAVPARMSVEEELGQKTPTQIEFDEIAPIPLSTTRTHLSEEVTEDQIDGGSPTPSFSSSKTTILPPSLDDLPSFDLAALGPLPSSSPVLSLQRDLPMTPLPPITPTKEKPAFVYTLPKLPKGDEAEEEEPEREEPAMLKPKTSSGSLRSDLLPSITPATSAALLSRTKQRLVRTPSEEKATTEREEDRLEVILDTVATESEDSILRVPFASTSTLPPQKERRNGLGFIRRFNSMRSLNSLDPSSGSEKSAKFFSNSNSSDASLNLDGEDSSGQRGGGSRTSSIRSSKSFINLTSFGLLRKSTSTQDTSSSSLPAVSTPSSSSFSFLKGKSSSSDVYPSRAEHPSSNSLQTISAPRSPGHKPLPLQEKDKNLNKSRKGSNAMKKTFVGLRAFAERLGKGSLITGAVGERK